MKNLQFRIFDKINWEWLKNEIYLNLNKGYIFQWAGLDIIPLEKDRIDIQQSTGIEDINGQMIFEGDIIKFCYCGELLFNDETEKYYFNDQDYQITIVKDEGIIDGDFEDNGFCSWTINFAFCSDYSFEIIGNIYDNPELLKKENN